MNDILDRLKEYIDKIPIEEIQKTLDKYKHLDDNTITIDDAEEWLQKERDIWNNPYISDQTNKNSYKLVELLTDFANFILKDK